MKNQIWWWQKHHILLTLQLTSISIHVSAVVYTHNAILLRGIPNYGREGRRGGGRWTLFRYWKCKLCTAPNDETILIESLFKAMKGIFAYTYWSVFVSALPCFASSFMLGANVLVIKVSTLFTYNFVRNFVSARIQWERNLECLNHKERYSFIPTSFNYFQKSVVTGNKSNCR